MKQVTNMSRLVNQLEKMFRALNQDFFDGQLDMPVITVTPSNRSYAHYTPWDAWETADTARREINIASGTLDRPLEDIAGSLMHEMVHMYNDTILHVQDVCRNGTYHNRFFAKAAREHGLICMATEKYGCARTAPAEALLDWLITHDELREIEMCRVTPVPVAACVGSCTADSGAAYKGIQRSNSRRYICPACRCIIRATRAVNILCGDCMRPMRELM